MVSLGLPKQQQLSGRQWIAAVDHHDRLSGRLQFSYTNTKDEADLQIDAALLKEFPSALAHDDPRRPLFWRIVGLAARIVALA